MDGDGDFVVVWGSGGSGGTDLSIQSIQAQRYASDGVSLAPQTERLNSCPEEV